MIVKDSMVLIHLAKITLLEESCKYFKKVIIPKKVYLEVLVGKEKGYSDINIIEELIRKKEIVVKKVNDKKGINKAGEFNIYGGEAEAVALYWQEKASYLATDDDNVRNKRLILNIIVIGTPVILLKLYKEKRINKEKLVDSINELRRIGWFNNSVLDKALMEAR